MANGPLEKMRILAYPSPLFEQSGPPALEYELMFNPASYSQTFAMGLDLNQQFGANKVLPKFHMVKPQVYSFDFIIDGTGATGDSRDVDKDTKRLLKIVGFFGEIHAPFFLTLNWGTFTVRAVLQDISFNYDLFDPSGKPIRAKVKASFVEAIPDLLAALLGGKTSPDLTHFRVFKEGDTLPVLCREIYGDENLYIEVAAANDITNFRNIKPGTELSFPPIDKEEA